MGIYEAATALLAVARDEVFLDDAVLAFAVFFFAVLAFANCLVRLTKQRSKALSTRSSTDSDDSLITSEISEMTRNFARSSIRFSRKERFFDWLRWFKLFKTSTTS